MRSSLLEKYGYSKEQIERILTNPFVSKMRDELLFEHVNKTNQFLKDYGYKNDQIIRISSNISNNKAASSGIFISIT